MEYDLSKVHQANLSILKEIDRICRKHQIKYMLDAGTLIGAVRHQGFIPWDDDADIVFTRDNYEKFIAAAATELDGDMELLDYRQLKGGQAFYDFTSRIIYLPSQTHDDTDEMKYYEGKLNHLWVDLFVLDQLPDYAFLTTAVILIQKIIYGMAMGHRYQLDFSKYSLCHKIFVGFLAAVGKLIPLQFLFRMQEKISKWYHNTNGKIKYYSNYQPDYLYVRVRNEWCDEVVDLNFCDTVLMVPKGWHEILTEVYGDYRKLPPKEQQQPTHSSIEIKVFK